jgi:hypothetical protein
LRSLSRRNGEAAKADLKEVTPFMKRPIVTWGLGFAESIVVEFKNRQRAR